MLGMQNEYQYFIQAFSEIFEYQSDELYHRTSPGICKTTDKSQQYAFKKSGGKVRLQQRIVFIAIIQEEMFILNPNPKIAHTLFLHQSGLSDDKQAGSIIFPSYRLAMSKTDRRSERNWDVHI